MIKLKSLYNEIKLYSNKFPHKNFSWKYKCNNKEELINLVQKLEQNQFQYTKNNPINLNDSHDPFILNMNNKEAYPMIVFYKKDKDQLNFYINGNDEDDNNIDQLWNDNSDGLTKIN